MYLEKNLVVAIHEELIARFGGIRGIRDEALLESAVARCRCGYYSDHLEEAAALMESLANNHPFLDGNKRIAVTAACVFLQLNGYIVEFEDSAAYNFISGLFSRREYSFVHLLTWLREAARPC
jgi:death-on-curing protein